VQVFALHLVSGHFFCPPARASRPMNILEFAHCARYGLQCTYRAKNKDSNMRRASPLGIAR
jgi:hypothetical protein